MPHALVRSEPAVYSEVGVGVYRDRCLVFEGHPSLPVSMVFVPLLVRDWRWFELKRPAEGLF